MSKNISRSLTYWLGVTALGLIVGLSIQFVRAWTEPSVAPPGGNVGAPVNTSNIPQTKNATLTIKTGTGNWGLINNAADMGVVGTWIGTESGRFSAQIGTATNTPLDFFTNGSNPQMTLATDGKVGIGGMLDPKFSLHVKGAIQATGDICTDLDGGVCLSKIGIERSHTYDIKVSPTTFTIPPGVTYIRVQLWGAGGGGGGTIEDTKYPSSCVDVAGGGGGRRRFC